MKRFFISMLLFVFTICGFLGAKTTVQAQSSDYSDKQEKVKGFRVVTKKPRTKFAPEPFDSYDVTGLAMGVLSSSVRHGTTTEPLTMAKT